MRLRANTKCIIVAQLQLFLGFSPPASYTYLSMYPSIALRCTCTVSFQYSPALSLNLCMIYIFWICFLFYFLFFFFTVFQLNFRMLFTVIRTQCSTRQCSKWSDSNCAANICVCVYIDYSFVVLVRLSVRAATAKSFAQIKYFYC